MVQGRELEVERGCARVGADRVLRRDVGHMNMATQRASLEVWQQSQNHKFQKELGQIIIRRDQGPRRGRIPLEPSSICGVA